MPRKMDTSRCSRAVCGAWNGAGVRHGAPLLRKSRKSVNITRIYPGNSGLNVSEGYPAMRLVGIRKSAMGLVNTTLARFGWHLSPANAIPNLQKQFTVERDNLRLEYEVVRDALKRGYCPDVFGHSMYTNPRDAGMLLGSLNGRDIADFQGEIGFFVRNIRPGNRVLDLGANVGLFTLLFARCVGPSGMVYAFEPGPLSTALLTANVILNGYQNVIIERAAVTTGVATSPSMSAPAEKATIASLEWGRTFARVAGHSPRHCSR